MKLRFNISFRTINPWKILRFTYKTLLIVSILLIIANFFFLYIYFYQPVTEARITVTLTYDTIFQKINKALFDRVSDKIEKRRESMIDTTNIRDPFQEQTPE